ncbi:MAG: glutamyl-tRNA reductase [Micrococcales bacterium]|nr:glutamyl-tRNA reductase [Micrococcales bacterium]
MSLLVLGVSHQSAPLDVLEKVAAVDVGQALPMVGTGDAVGEALLLSTCNRIEVYTEVSRFHAAVESITAILAKSSGLSPDQLSAHLYVHYEDAAVRHAFRVASGLDSMVVGDEQILGQFREAFKVAIEHGQAGRSLHELAQSALRVGKRVQTDTAIGRHGASVVEVALAQARRHFGTLAGRHVVILGSGSMSSLAASVSASPGRQVTIVGTHGRVRAPPGRGGRRCRGRVGRSRRAVARRRRPGQCHRRHRAAGHPRAPAEGAGRGEPQPVRVRPRPAA